MIARVAQGIAVAGACLWGTVPLAAQDMRALVIGTPGANATTAFADAYHAANALRASGLTETLLLRDAPLSDLEATFEAMRGPGRVLIYYAGSLGAPDEAPRLRSSGGSSSPSLALDGIARDIGDEAQVIVLLENCAHRVTDPTGTVETVPDGLSLALTAVAGQPCPEAGARLSDRLIAGLADDGASTDLKALLDGFWVGPAPEDATWHGAPPEPAPSADNSPIISLLPAEPALNAETVAPVRENSSPEVVRNVAQTAPARRSSNQVLVFAPTPDTQLAARAVAAGLPEPSVIVGLIPDQTEASFSPADETPGEITSNEITYDDIDARRQLRAEDPALFETLVASGAFDPPGPLLARALQEELARMGCYTAGIDGVWGNGSRNSVRRYFDEIDGASAETLEPEPGLFRQIIRQDDIACPVVAAASPSPAPAARRSSPARSAPAARSQPAPRAAQPAPQQPATNSPAIGGTTMGVFR
ncbi:MAG: hypothetical protein RID11_09925 [Roseovarius sp.]|uniref:hypothetical protein n=1 Tax=Roseovarius sp. TaxID=1486281 RepID=UPI0032EAAFA4